MSALGRFIQSLPSTLMVQRAHVSIGDDGDLLVGVSTGELETVIGETPGLISRLSPSVDMKTAMPIEYDRAEVYLPPTVALEKHDIITDFDDDTVWVVDGVPQQFTHRGQPHHVQATIIRRAVR